MIPHEVPRTIRQDPKRAAEVSVFDALKVEPLMKGFSVWYSSRWLAPYAGALRDGEADFIVATPEIGFIALEIKGGGVRRDEHTGLWTSEDAAGIVYDIEDPVEQAMKSKKVLLDFLLKHWPTKPPFIWNRHGVILPHCSRPRAASDLGAAMPLDIFAFRDDMGALGAHVMKMMLWQPDGLRHSPEPFGTIGIDLIDRFRGRGVAFNISLKGSVEDSEAAIDLVTEDQNRLLDNLQAVQRARFRGGAGTGKTTLAIEKARRLSAAGSSTLLLCYNRPLRVHLEEKLAGTGIAVATFHELCGKAARSANLDLREPFETTERKRFMSETLPSALEQAALLEKIVRYDAILVDEGQDFKADWLESVRLLLKPHAQNVMYVFSDDNQNIYSGDPIGEAYGETVFLCDNVRNSKPIFEVGSKFYAGSGLRCRGPDGPEVRWISVGPPPLLRSVERQLNGLIGVEGFAPGDIAVLTGCAVDKSTFAGLSAIGTHEFDRADTPASGRLVVDTVYRFKGLDKPVVLLTHMDEYAVEPALAYVGLSRAKSLLVVLAGETILRSLRRKILD